MSTLPAICDFSYVDHQHVIDRSGIEPVAVGDVCVGTVLTPDAAYYARAAMLATGFPESVPVQVINRFCSSGLMAVTTVANQIRSGQIEIGLAVGIESMSEKFVGPNFFHSHFSSFNPKSGPRWSVVQ